MFSQIKFTLTEALLIASLIPCAFLAVYILGSTKNKKFAIIPSLYFISLAAGLFYNLMPAFSFAKSESTHIAFILIFLNSLMPAISFLLILQMAFNTIPSFASFGILAIPTISTSPFIYGFTTSSIACTSDIDICFSSEYALHLNIAVVSSFIFMLLIFIFSRRYGEIEGDPKSRQYKYWVIICLIIYNLILIGIEIGFSTQLMDIKKYTLSKALINIAFIYIIMTSIFRVFSDHFEIDTPTITMGKSPLTEYEISVGTRAEKILNLEKIYREPGFNRASFAKKLGVREHVLSRIINTYFNKSFSELANEYRLREAKELLTNTDLSITAISYDVGFSSITSFNRVFKEMIKQSPTEFREKSHKNITGEIQNA